MLSSISEDCSKKKATSRKPRRHSARHSALQPNFALPHARLATLLRGKLPDADFTALEERLADPQLAPEVRATAVVRPGPRP